MRVVIVTEQYPPMLGGVATVTHNLSRDLAGAGHEVWVVAPSEGPHGEYAEHGRVRVQRFASFEWPAYDGQRIAFPPLAPLRKLLRTVRPDVLHIHSPIVLGNLARLLSSAMRVPVVATNHFMAINVAPSLSADPLLGKGFEALTYGYLVGFYNRCDFVTAPTATALDFLKRHGLRAPCRAVSNGIDLGRFQPGPRDEALRRRLGLPADRPLLLYVGRLSEEKRVNVLLDAMARLHEPAHLAIAGGGPAARALEGQAATLGIARRVSFLGRVPDEELVDLYRLADVFAMPSVAELQSLAALEALAVGTPVVAADAGALPELVHDGENGLLFARDEGEALARALARLAASAELRRAMGARALETAARHDRRRIVREWEGIYAGAGSLRRPRPAWARHAAGPRGARRLSRHRPARRAVRARAPLVDRTPGEERLGGAGRRERSDVG
jgi:glycosyltransferase involved in cell wall biosynthesis